MAISNTKLFVQLNDGQTSCMLYDDISDVGNEDYGVIYDGEKEYYCKLVDVLTNGGTLGVKDKNNHIKFVSKGTEDFELRAEYTTSQYITWNFPFGGKMKIYTGTGGTGVKGNNSSLTQGKESVYSKYFTINLGAGGSGGSGGAGWRLRRSSITSDILMQVYGGGGGGGGGGAGMDYIDDSLQFAWHANSYGYGSYGGTGATGGFVELSIPPGEGGIYIEKVNSNNGAKGQDGFASRYDGSGGGKHQAHCTIGGNGGTALSAGGGSTRGFGGLNGSGSGAGTGGQRQDSIDWGNSGGGGGGGGGAGYRVVDTEFAENYKPTTWTVSDELPRIILEERVYK